VSDNSRDARTDKVE